jgi:hypothetical protein
MWGISKTLSIQPELGFNVTLRFLNAGEEKDHAAQNAEYPSV